MSRTYYSVGGGFVVDEAATGADRIKLDDTPVRYPFPTGVELLAAHERTGLRISDIMLANEQSWRTEAEIRAGLLHIWQVMRDCVERGSQRDGVLPGGLKVRRRAAELRRALESGRGSRPAAGDGLGDPVRAGGERGERVGRAGGDRADQRRGRHRPGRAALLHPVRAGGRRRRGGALPARRGAVGVLFKENASISGAEVGCQGEVGSACSMAAAGLAEVLGGYAGAGGERRRDRDGAQPRADLRPGRRPGADPVHRAQRGGLGQGDHRQPGWRCAATVSTRCRWTR